MSLPTSTSTSTSFTSVHGDSSHVESDLPVIIPRHSASKSNSEEHQLNSSPHCDSVTAGFRTATAGSSTASTSKHTIRPGTGLGLTSIPTSTLPSLQTHSSTQPQHTLHGSTLSTIDHTAAYPLPSQPQFSSNPSSAEVGHTGITRRRQSVSSSNPVPRASGSNDRVKPSPVSATTSSALGWITGNRLAAPTGYGKGSKSDDDEVDGSDQWKAREKRRAVRKAPTGGHWDWRMAGVPKNGEASSSDHLPGFSMTAPSSDQYAVDSTYPHMASASRIHIPATQTQLSSSLRPLAQDPNNILPLSLPPTPMGSPPMSRVPTPYHSPYHSIQDLAAEYAASAPLASGSSSSPRTSISTSSSRFGWGGGNRSDSRSSAEDEDGPSFSASRHHHRSWWPRTPRSRSPRLSVGSRSNAPHLVRISSAANRIIPSGTRRWGWLLELVTNPFGLRPDVTPTKATTAKQRNRERERLTNGPTARRKASQTVLGSRRIARAMLFVPTSPWSISLFLFSLAAFAVALTFTLKHILNPDKAALPWRQYCTSSQPTLYSLQDPFLPPTHIGSESEYDPDYTPYGDINPLPVNSFAPSSAKALSLMPLTASHAAWPYHPHDTPPFSQEMDIKELDEALEPVGILIGVFSTDAGVERRNMIRQSYASHWRSRRDGTEGVRIRFVLGRPRKRFERAVQLEMEAFNDILLLDMPENMNSGKTHAFFSWAAANATVPDWEYPAHPRGSDGTLAPVWRGEKPPAYVVKADEDSFIMLGELEKRLRIIPRSKAFWGYLVKNTFMAGECYALSFDLVQYIGASPALRTMKRGKEDKLVAKWMNMHPEREKIVWATERCWIYDHPKAGTVYSHGFLYPSTVDQVRMENRTGLPPSTLSARGGVDAASAYSTVSKFGVAYRPLSEDMSAVETVEALVEGSALSQLREHDQSAESRTSSLREKIARAVESRPSRSDRFIGDSEESGGTVVVHYIKKPEWFLETMVALLGSADEQSVWHRGVGVGLGALERRKGRIVSGREGETASGKIEKVQLGKGDGL